MFDIPCVIFAGGRSSRMGEDKSLLPFGSFDTLTQYQLFRLKKMFEKVYISCKDKNKFNFDAEFIEDIDTNGIFAPTGGFVSVFEKLKCDAFFAISVDTPFIDEESIQKLIKTDTADVDATIAKLNGKIQPMCGIYHISLETKFKHMLNTDNHKLGYLIRSSKTAFVDFEDEKTFLNLNHPHEYKEALALILL